ncbi:MAG: hypothetical protein MUD12_10920 [Spirochaetes bacterium]|jgi:hypothetical protein|nr:hypothetical protein [Spirochaetota bacterium]
MKNCEKIMGIFLELDNGEALPPRAVIHRMFCGRCRTEMRRLKDSISDIRAGSPFEPADDITETVMTGLMQSGASHGKRVSNLNWLGAGLIMLGGVFILSFSESFKWLSAFYGKHIEIPVSIVLSLILCIYAVIFIGTHLDFIKERINLPFLKINR